MENPQPPNQPPEPRSSGCMKWSCGCLVGAVLLIGIALVAIWLLLNRWNPDNSGWRHLPPGTTFAVEAHDIHSLLDNIFADPGMEGLLRRVIRPMFPEEAAEGDSFNELVETYHRAGFLYRLAAPNSAVIGKCADFPDDLFCIMQMPVWLRTFMNLSLPPGELDTFDTDDPELHFAHRDGLLLAAVNPELIQNILNNWDSGATPLGTPPEADGPRLYLATRPETAAGPEDSTKAGEPGHFMFADPFATAPSTSSTAEQGGYSIRLSLSPNRPGWECRGDLGPGTVWLDDTASLTESVRNILVGDTTGYQDQTGIGVIVRADISPDGMESLRRASARIARDASFSPGDLRKDLAMEWLHDAWLANAGETWRLSIGPAASSDADLPYPPLPVIGIGWTVRETTTAAAAAQAFGTAITTWLDGLKAGAATRRDLEWERLVTYTPVAEAGIRGGRLELPSILVNGAVPTWRIDTGTGQAWFATDPTGFTKEKAGYGEAPEVIQPGQRQAILHGEWTADEKFLTDLSTFILDRYSNLPTQYRRNWPDSLSLIRHVFTMREILATYPKGSFRLHADIDRPRYRFSTSIPYGHYEE